MMLRRIVTFLLVFSLCGHPAFAAGNVTPEEDALEEAIIYACTYQEEVELSEYQISRGDFDVLFDDLYYSGKLPWYTTGSYDLTYNPNTDHMVSFTPEPVPESVDIAAYEQRVAEILHDCLLPGMTPVQIALVLHDYLAANTFYDLTLEHNSGYDAIVNGTSACAGYAEAYRDLMNRAGIETIYVSSDEMDHAWNLVCIDGNWYHVDVTWDDPTPHIEGRLRHIYFLRTDEEMRNSEDAYSGWETDITCTDTRFSDAWWLDVKSQICYKSASGCYLIRTDDFVNSIYFRNEDTGLEKRIYQEKRSSIDIGAGYYKYSHYGLSYRGGMLYFNTLDAVMRMDPETGGIWVQHGHSGNTYICSSNVSGDTLAITYMTHDSQPSHETQSLEPLDTHRHSYTQSQVESTCAQAGYTQSACSCGVTFQSAPVKPLPHDYSYQPHWDLTVTKTCKACDHVSVGPLIPKDYQLSAVLFVVGIFFTLRAVLPRKKRKG